MQNMVLETRSLSTSATHRQAAAALLHCLPDEDGNQADDPHLRRPLLPALASLHDRALPQAAAALSQPGAAASATAAAAVARRAHLRLEQLVCQLVTAAFLDVGSGGSTAGSCEMNPERRGSEMMRLLMGLPDSFPDHQRSGSAKGSPDQRHFLAAANARFGLDVAVVRAVKQVVPEATLLSHSSRPHLCSFVFIHCTPSPLPQGVIALDDVQYDYLLALMETADRAQVEALAASQPPPPRPLLPGHPQSAAADAEAGPSGSSGTAPGAEVLSLIAQIRDMLPDYGTGFLTACLHKYDMKPDQVGVRRRGGE